MNQKPTVNRTNLVNSIALSLAVEMSRVAHFHFQQQDSVDFAIEIDAQISRAGFSTNVIFDKELEIRVEGDHEILMPHIKKAIQDNNAFVAIHFMFSRLSYPQSTDDAADYHYEARQLGGRGNKVMIIFREKNQ